MATQTYKTGPPRLKAMERLLHRFYEPLQLLWMLCPARGPCPLAATACERSPDFLSNWRAFLDALSWLCDFEHGGKTVSSVAAESLPSGNCFWLSCRHQEALPHLVWVLESLETAQLHLQHERLRAVQSIATTTIFHSGDKVKHYRQKLARNIAKASTSTSLEILSGMYHGCNEYLILMIVRTCRTDVRTKRIGLSPRP